MCGIILHANFKYKDSPPQQANESVINQYQDQYQRGTQGYGAVMINEEREICIKRATEATKMLIDLYSVEAPIVLLHHRTPTSSKNKISQTHPIFVHNDKLKFAYLIMHNGVISNDDEIKALHEKEGFNYTTHRALTETTFEFNDSECLAIELALFMEKIIPTMRVSGSAAFIGVKIDKKSGKAINLIW